MAPIPPRIGLTFCFLDFHSIPPLLSGICIISNPHLYFQASVSHIMQIVAIVNEKFRERVPAWDVSCPVTFTVYVVTNPAAVW